MAKRGFSARNTKSTYNAERRLRRLLQKCDTVMEDTFVTSAAILESEIKREVPYLTGALQRSVMVELLKDGNGKWRIIADAKAYNERTNYNYAGIQHENEAYQHTEGRKAHYISDPMQRSIDRIKVRLREEIKP